MSNSIIDVLTSLNLTPTYLLILGALIGYFRHQHAGGKVPGALSIPNDLLKSSEFNKLWTLLYVVLLPLSWIVNVFAYAVYALMWLINVIGGIVHWAASKLIWVWNQVIIGLGGFSFYQLWHYLVKWPYQLFNILLSTFVASFNWATYKSTYRGVAIASLVGVSGFLLDDIFDFEFIELSTVSIIVGILFLLEVVSHHMAESMGVQAKAMRPMYRALIITAVVVVLADYVAQEYLLIDNSAGFFGGIVLGISVVTWTYGILITAAVIQFLSLLIPAYLESEGEFNWLQTLRTTFASRWLKSIGSIALFVIGYNTLGLWVYDNVKQVASEPYEAYVSIIDQHIIDNDSALVEAESELAAALASDSVTSQALNDAYTRVRSIEAGNAFWYSVPTELRDIVYMEVNRPFTTKDSAVDAAKEAYATYDSTVTQMLADHDSAIAKAQVALADAEAERDRVAETGITASEDGRIQDGEAMRFGMPIPDDSDNLKWRITNAEGDTIVKRNGETLSHRFSTGSYTVYAAPINGCGMGQWSSYEVGVDDEPAAPLTIGVPRGRDQVCAGDEYTYTTTSGMDKYYWKIPSGATGETDGNTAKIKWGNSSGDVSVTGELGGVKSNTANLYVRVSGAPGAALADEGTDGNEYPERTENVQDNFVVTASEGDAMVASAQENLAGAESAKSDFEATSTVELAKLNAEIVDLRTRVSTNGMQKMTSWLGKAMFLFVLCLMLAVALNLVVIWTSKYFGRLYNHNQEGSSYFRSSLEEYQGRYEGFPYLGLFVFIVLVVVGGMAGIEATQGLSETLQNGDFPMISDLY